MMFKRILVALDGSVNAKQALAHAVAIAKGVGAERIGLVHVRPSLHTLAHAYGHGTVGPSYPMFAEWLQQDIKRAEEGPRKLLAEAESFVRSAGLEDIPVVQHSEEGAVVDRILKVVRRDGYDLLVLGSRGMGRAAGLLLGSVSQSVVANLPCSVTIVEADREAVREAPADL